jgi:hypothetical protein
MTPGKVIKHYLHQLEQVWYHSHFHSLGLLKKLKKKGFFIMEKYTIGVVGGVENIYFN